tara:strand:- start:298 stop:531 length:234 start_codon:yes stop_codon:yes gene_type:complete
VSYTDSKSRAVMDEILTDTEDKLLIQQQDLADKIRAAEDSLMRDKELYLKVTGALEGIAIVKQRMAPKLTEAVTEAN